MNVYGIQQDQLQNPYLTGSASNDLPNEVIVTTTEANKYDIILLNNTLFKT